MGGNKSMISSANNDHYITKGTQHKRTNSSDTNGKLYKSSDEMLMMYEQQKKRTSGGKNFINWNGVMNTALENRVGESASHARNSIVVVPNQQAVAGGIVKQQLMPENFP